MSRITRSEPYTIYPLSSVILFNATTLLHFALASTGLYLAFSGSWAGPVLALAYLAFALGQMYVLMPLRVCPNCSYYRMDEARCVSALNLLARRIAYQGKPQHFKRRAKGPLCHNNLYLAALAVPIPLLLAGLALEFSAAVLVLTVSVAALLVFRIAVLFRRTACPNCAAKQRCPNAARLGIR